MLKIMISHYYGKAVDNVQVNIMQHPIWGFVVLILDCSCFGLQKVPVYIMDLYLFLQKSVYTLYICYKTKFCVYYGIQRFYY